MASSRPFSNPRHLLSIYFLIIYILCVFSRANSLFFNFTSFHDNGGDIVLQGDAYISSQDGHIELTTNSVDRSSFNSSGRAIFASLLPLWDKASGGLADIATGFSFVINSLNDTHHGDGFMLFLADPALPDVDEAKGGGIGLLRGDQVIDSYPFRFFGLEFDTFPNDFDPGYEHVGVDINSLKSSVQVGWCNSVMQGKENDVRIRYDSGLNNLSVIFSGYCNGSDTKFEQYLHYQVDLASFLPEKVVFGFAASTGVVSELHVVKSWYMNSSLAVAVAPNTAPPSGHSPEPDRPSPKHLPNWAWELIGGVVIIVLVFVITAFITLICIRKRRKNARIGLNNIDSSAEIDQNKEADASTQFTQFHTSTDTNLQETSLQSIEGLHEDRVVGDDQAGSSSRHGSERYSPQSMDDELRNSSVPKVYTYEELSTATNGFDNKDPLGEGGFGNVIKGTIGTVNIAVKVSIAASPEKAEQYASEVLTITQVKHKNLVRLLGWCHENDRLLLVYEFLSMGSLDKHVLGTYMLMPFELRYSIVVGLAEAVHYLHEGLKECVLHRDIKLSNILLDSMFRPKLADFGLAKIMNREKLEYTTRLAGTLGYMAPELFSTTGKFSKATDMYSFGVVVLEVACGRRALVNPNANGEGSGGKGLVPWVWELFGSGKLIDAADSRLMGGFDKKKMVGLLMVGLRCTNPNWESRMSILQAWQELKGAPPKLPRLSSKRPVPL